MYRDDADQRGNPLHLPLTEDIGTALIDYLRNGRPKTDHREVFLRANAPFEPFADNNNLHHIITTYRRRAGISLPAKNRRGLQSLRHTMASRLLEEGIPLESISSVMGHLSLETTRLYTKVHIAGISAASPSIQRRSPMREQEHQRRSVTVRWQN